MTIIFMLPEAGITELERGVLKARALADKYADAVDDAWNSFWDKQPKKFKGLGLLITPKEASKFSELSSQDVVNIAKREVGTGLLDGTLYLIDELDEALKKAGVRLAEEKIPAALSEIKGEPAYKGVIQGRVRLVSLKRDVPSLLEGEILVSEMTSPAYLPAIIKSAAVITDEGGVTCHAAIVCRELKKLCIIGTKIATQVLKDGDFIEVDANQGTVKILKTS